MTNKQTDTRKRELAAIHIAKAKLGLGDEAYRILLYNNFGYESSADLSATQRRALLAILGNLQKGGKPAAKKCLSIGLKTRLYEAFKSTPQVRDLLKFSAYICGRALTSIDELTDDEARHVLAAFGGYHR